MHDWLGQVPRVWVSDPKELHYFDRYRRRGLEWYAEQFAPGADDVAWGESTPIYLYRDNARTALARSLPDARFIAILREPVSRAYSQYCYARAKGVEALETFEAAVAAEPERLAAHRYRQPAIGSYLDRGRYHRQLTALAGVVGRERIQVHLLEDVQQDPLGTLRRTCEFVGVADPEIDRVELRTKNRFGARTINTAGAPRSGGSTTLLTTANDRYPPIDSALQHELRARFARDNALLAQWLGRDLSDWG
jgi:hypothetical protein